MFKMFHVKHLKKEICMYIEPKTNIRLLSGVPLDTTYEHSLSWAFKTDQYNYFVSKTKYNLTEYNYIRVSNGVARVGIQAENLYDCNYMMFQNTAFGNKWFYAFVTEIVYLNNGTSEIHFTIDDLQTWYFEFTLDHCFVERETTETDEYGEHIEAEPVATGEYVMHSQERITQIGGSYSIIVAQTYTPEDYSAGGRMYDNIFSGSTLFRFSKDDVSAVNRWIGNFTTAPDTITNIYMCPDKFLTGGHINTRDEVEAGTLTPLVGGGANFEADIKNDNRGSNLTDIDGYSPKNRKLFTYPYCFYNVVGGDSSLQLRYELFKGFKVKMLCFSTMSFPCTMVAYPLNYKGISKEGESDRIYPAENITLANFPQCSWNFDAYKVYMAQNAVPDAIKAVTTGIGAGISIGMGGQSGVASGATQISNYVGDLISRHYSASIQEDIYKGNYSTGTNASSNGNNDLWGGCMTVTHQQARIIDNFFSKYGYAVNVVKVPDIRSRKHFNYIKTVACTATGNIPSDSMRNICHIFDNGITFWKNPAEVGDYSDAMLDDNRAGKV